MHNVDRTDAHQPVPGDAKMIAEEFKDYAYIVSHDLGAPVRAMVEFSKLLHSEHGNQLDDEAKEFLSIIVENGTKLQNMMAALLDYSRLNTAVKSYTQVDCNHLIEVCRNTMAQTITATDAVITTEGLPVVTADAEQFVKVFETLLDNAMKFQPAGNAPQIKVAARQEGEHWHFTVSDNGIGIEERFFDRIFKLFRRLHGDEEYTGQGMGLTLAHKILGSHGGRIWCESEPGKGSVFHFTMPVQA
ncbi:MAG: ATP-binding protein [Alphaproteobacteria bacterium]